MNKPEMIIFDYGHTLLYQPGWDAERGDRELFKYIIQNPNNITFKDYMKVVNQVFGKMEDIRKNEMCEVTAAVGYKVVAELLNIEFSLTPLEQELVFWNGATKGAIMPYADKMIDYINANGIRSAVISNLIWSGNALTTQLNRLLPNNRFEFVMTSSDYLFRKPNKILFEIALKKAGLSADKVWYCGDSIKADIYGAHGAGIFPVLYEGKTVDDVNPFALQNGELKIDFDYLHIHDWREMIEILEDLFLI